MAIALTLRGDQNRRSKRPCDSKPPRNIINPPGGSRRRHRHFVFYFRRSENALTSADGDHLDLSGGPPDRSEVALTLKAVAQLT
jgi:hypothetical protein